MAKVFCVTNSVITGTMIISAGQTRAMERIFSVLIDAFSEVKKEIPDSVFILPEKDHFEELEKKVKRRRTLGKRYFFRKSHQQAQLFEYIKAADMFV